MVYRHPLSSIQHPLEDPGRWTVHFTFGVKWQTLHSFSLFFFAKLPSSLRIWWTLPFSPVAVGVYLGKQTFRVRWTKAWRYVEQNAPECRPDPKRKRYEQMYSKMYSIPTIHFQGVNLLFVSGLCLLMFDFTFLGTKISLYQPALLNWCVPVPVWWDGWSFPES